ncbi:catalase-related domain-containing protein [Bacillus sp. AF62]
MEKEHLAENLASDLKVISDDIREIVLGYFNQVSTDLKTSIETKMKEH